MTQQISKKFTIWHAVLIYAFANGISGLTVGILGDFEFYNSFVQPSIAPPDWLFAPMWFFLNITSLWALHRVANLPDGGNKKAVIRLESLAWILYATFAFFYFVLQSPVLGASNTVAGMLVTSASLIYCAKLDKKSACLIGLRLIWLLLASYVGVYMAVFNADAFINSYVGAQ